MKNRMIDGNKVQNCLEELYACGKKEDGTHSRVVFSDEYKKGLELFTGWFQKLGIPTRTDAAGNTIARLEGSDLSAPAILIGSHLDTVPDGGKYDGALGCVAGLAVCEALLKAGIKLRHPVEVISFFDEEGVLFGNGLYGSSIFCGETKDFLAEDLDTDGHTRAEDFEKWGTPFETRNRAFRPDGTVHCSLELHVEQGAILHKSGVPIGVVSSIAGVKRFEITISGQANHAGSTMMKDRNDALVAAAKLISEVPAIVERAGEAYSVATVGAIRVVPGSVNVIPGVCTFFLEIRDQKEQCIEKIENEIRAKLANICTGSNMSADIRSISYHKPAPMCGWVKEAIWAACNSLGEKAAEIPSGAFHDSLPLANRFSAGMIFVPSVDGISHSPLEYTAPQAIEQGCNVLLETILEIDKK